MILTARGQQFHAAGRARAIAWRRGSVWTWGRS